MNTSQRIVTSLMFDRQAEAAVNFYISLIPDSRILFVNYFGPDEPGPVGTVCAIKFQLAGQDFWAVNGGPSFKFTEAISLYLRCATQAEIDFLWVRLSDGGTTSMCGWLTDRYGVSWQIVPEQVDRMLCDADPARVRRVMKAIFGMQKLDIEALEKAYG